MSFEPKVGPDGFRRYNQWAGNPSGQREDEQHCVASVSESGRGLHSYQCVRKRGHGKGGLYCKIHDPEYIAKKDKERAAKYDIQHKRDVARWEAPAKLAALEKKYKTLQARLASAELVVSAARYAEQPTGKIFFGDVNNEVENRRANFRKALKAHDSLKAKGTP